MFTLASGYALSLLVVAVSSTNLTRDLILVTVLFALLGLFPLFALRRPRPVEVPFPKQKKRVGFLRRWLKRRSKRREHQHIMWKRRPGQESNRPWGTPETGPPTVFAPARRGRKS